MNKKVCAVIPAYNEEKTIGEVVRNCKKYIDTIFVVDDGSSDGTAEIARQAGAEVITHKINRGVGAAQRTGYRVAIMNGFDYIVQIDADGQHNPKYIPEMLKAAFDGADIVIASRFRNNSYKNFSFVRRIGVSFFSKVVSLFGGIEVSDVTSGFRVYRAEALKRIGRLPDKNWAVEQTLEAAIKGLKIAEVSVEMPPRKIGESQFSFGTFLRYPWRALESILRIAIFRRD